MKRRSAIRVIAHRSEMRIQRRENNSGFSLPTWPVARHNVAMKFVPSLGTERPTAGRNCPSGERTKMQFKYAALVSAAVSLISQSSRAEWAYDAVDALLAPGPSGAVGEPLSPPSSVQADDVSSIGQTSAGLAAPEPAPYSGQAPLSATLDQPSTKLDQPDSELAISDLDTGNSVAPTAGHHKSKPFSRIDVVPEPSALAMATVALIFFLLFGRRRRLG
jgi:hypothetical protein